MPCAFLPASLGSLLAYLLVTYTPPTNLQVGEEELFLGKTWKLNAERNNGRGAMMGITGTPHDMPQS